MFRLLTVMQIIIRNECIGQVSKYYIHRAMTYRVNCFVNSGSIVLKATYLDIVNSQNQRHRFGGQFQRAR